MLRSNIKRRVQHNGKQVRCTGSKLQLVERIKALDHPFLLLCINEKIRETVLKWSNRFIVYKRIVTKLQLRSWNVLYLAWTFTNLQLKLKLYQQLHFCSGCFSIPIIAHPDKKSEMKNNVELKSSLFLVWSGLNNIFLSAIKE